MKAREWEHVVRATQRLRCQVARQSDTHVYIVRGAIRIFALRKCPVSVTVQRELMRVLEFDELEWIEAVEQTGDE